MTTLPNIIYHFLKANNLATNFHVFQLVLVLIGNKKFSYFVLFVFLKLYPFMRAEMLSPCIVYCIFVKKFIYVVFVKNITFSFVHSAFPNLMWGRTLATKLIESQNV